MKQQCVNPYLPSWEYVPDGEPHVYGERVYVYGSHDRAHGFVFCQNDYVCWSAPVDDLSDWRCEGVIYKKTQDPLNPEGHMMLYAPDVTRGPDGRYYLYYVLDKVGVVSVAVCDTPAGKYEFYGYVRDAEGRRLGERPGDEPQFDPGVLTEGDITYMYTGFSGIGDASRKGAMATVLSADMLTIVEEPVYIVPGGCYDRGTSFEGHAFFEASSIRKIGDTYYFIYSSVWMTELCYATSKHPTKDFVYGGVIVANCDLHIDSYKPAEKRTYPAGNNHGGIAQVSGQWYIFYHRMTNDTWFSRQACVEAITILPDGRIPQVEMTSQGANGKPLAGAGKYPAYIACNLWNETDAKRPARVTQDDRDSEEAEGRDSAYIADITDGTVIGFKYFEFEKVTAITLTTRAYGSGVFEVSTTPGGEVLGSVAIANTNVWMDFSAPVSLPKGVHALYLTYKGQGSPGLASFTLQAE